MPRKNSNEEARIGEKCKIRKRGCSSSSSSSLMHNYRLKRAILVRKKAGSNTPTPTWKMNTRLPLILHDNAASGKGKEASMSARKLAATLWEINDVHSRYILNDNFKEMHSKENVFKCSKLSSLPLPDVSCIPALEVEPQPRRRSAKTKPCLKDISEGLMTTKELVKVLNHICELDKQTSTSKSLVYALKFEIDSARSKVEKLIQEQQSDSNEIDYLLKQFAEERLAWKTKVQDRVDKAILFIARELEVEKKLRKQSERLSKKLGEELEITKATLSKAEKAMECEKRAREIMEQVCDELAKGIGEDKAEVEKEREMLQVADDLREARVQMKLSEAKFQFEEKNAVIDKLRSELEACLNVQKCEEKGIGSSNYDRIKELDELLHKSKDMKREDSPDSDLQSIELNVVENGKTCDWNYTDRKTERKSISVDTQKKTICLERQVSDGIEWEFSTKVEEDSNGLTNKERFVKFTSKERKEDNEDEIRRYKLIKDLRDHIVSGSGLAMLQGAA